MKRVCLGVVLLLSGLVPHAARAATRICVSVQQRSWYRPPPPRLAPAAPTAAAVPSPSLSPFPVMGPGFSPSPAAQQQQQPAGAPAPRPPATEADAAAARAQAAHHEIDPTSYLKRLLEYEVTHEPGFVSVDDRCEQRLGVELYQLEHGWTVFARYTGTEREEKVDHADLDEFGELAQRVATALLRNRPIAATITRENVLRADSEMNLRTIDGTGHFLFGMGTEVRIAHLDTAQGAGQPAAEELRLLTPVSVQIGYRRKLRAWGLDVFGRLNLGTENTGVHENDLGGHIDYSGSGVLGLHFLHYTDAPGINSFYFGGGAAFELAFFDAIRPLVQGVAQTRDSLVGGGLNLDVVAGYEFLRASSVHFFGQLELEAPAYVIKTENDSGSINTYMPGALAQIGVIF
jgi:hypothetical protein